jgi:hypothetical protein
MGIPRKTKLIVSANAYVFFIVVAIAVSRVQSLVKASIAL